MRKLGRGLSELGLTELLNGPVLEKHAESPKELHYLALSSIFPGAYQPRKFIDPQGLSELAESIRAQGVLQPIIVRRQAGDRYEIIAGERRWRAAQQAGLSKIPALVRDISDQTAIAFGLIENIQRRDLNAIEEARAIQRLLQEFNLTHEAAAQAVGKSRVAVSNLLRLLQLNPEVSALLVQGQIEMGHARALLAVEGAMQTEMAQQVIALDLSVRQTEQLVQRGAIQPANPAKPPVITQAIEHQQRISEKLGTRVTLRHDATGKGKMVVYYHDLQELERILERIQ